VQEDIFTAVVRGDETVTASRVKLQQLACSHL
jgi:hypothetical protein